ncbi:MAG TPA: hypothetical protein VNJ11_17000 [Bryobacteraceae bacterium]|nr:hypothetical protein [Bryobacteraceae bacterium]
MRLRTFSEGVLVALDDSNVAVPVVKLFGRDGYLKRRVPIAIEGAARVNVYAVAHGRDGSVAATGSAYSSDGRGAVWLALTAPDGNTQRVIRTNPFVPWQIAIAPDGACWAAGYEKQADGRVSKEHLMLRRFGPSGVQTGAYWPRSLFQTRPQYLHPTNYAMMVAGPDRMGWYSNATNEYVEWSLDGQMLVRLPGPELRNNDEVNGLGFCRDGAVYLSVSRILKRPGPGKSSVWTATPASGAWFPVWDGLLPRAACCTAATERAWWRKPPWGPRSISTGSGSRETSARKLRRPEPGKYRVFQSMRE